MELWLIVCDVLESHIIMPFNTLERMQNRSYVTALYIHYLSILVVISGVKSGKTAMQMAALWWMEFLIGITLQSCLQLNIDLYNAIQYNTTQYNTTQHNTIKYNAIRLNILVPSLQKHDRLCITMSVNIWDNSYAEKHS